MNQHKKLYYQFTGSIFLLLFVFIGYVVKFYPHSTILTTFDMGIIQHVQGFIEPKITEIMTFITSLGSPAFDIMVSVIIFAVFVFKRRYVEAIYLAINMALIAGVGNQVLKLIFHRERPDFLRLTFESGYSYPSGHAMGSLLLYGTIFILVCTMTKSKALHWLTGLVCAVLVIGVGISRIYLGVHYPSDIIGGWLMAGGYLLLTYPIFRQKYFIKEFRGEY